MQGGSHCGLPEACVVGPPGLGLPPPPPMPAVSGQYGDYVVTSHQDTLPYTSAHHPVPGSDFTSAMYVNTVWGAPPPPPGPPEQQTSQYYDPYPGGYGGGNYPGHMLAGQDGSLPPGYPGMALHDDHHHGGSNGKRKRRRVITYEQRKAANVRERKRMCHLNDAFDVLRKRVPTFAYEKKLSRIETLKLAVTYIQYMAELLEDLEDGAGGSKVKKSRKDGDKSSRNSDNSKENSPANISSDDATGSLDISGDSFSSGGPSQGELQQQQQEQTVVVEVEELCSSQQPMEEDSREEAAQDGNVQGEEGVSPAAPEH